VRGDRARRPQAGWCQPFRGRGSPSVTRTWATARARAGAGARTLLLRGLLGPGQEGRRSSEQADGSVALIRVARPVRRRPHQQAHRAGADPVLRRTVARGSRDLVIDLSGHGEPVGWECPRIASQPPPGSRATVPGYGHRNGRQQLRLPAKPTAPRPSTLRMATRGRDRRRRSDRPRPPVRALIALQQSLGAAGATVPCSWECGRPRRRGPRLRTCRPDPTALVYPVYVDGGCEDDPCGLWPSGPVPRRTPWALLRTSVARLDDALCEEFRSLLSTSPTTRHRPSAATLRRSRSRWSRCTSPRRT